MIILHVIGAVVGYALGTWVYHRWVDLWVERACEAIVRGGQR